jgi:Pregnancy-associated plasma protein-A
VSRPFRRFAAAAAIAAVALLVPAAAPAAAAVPDSGACAAPAGGLETRVKKGGHGAEPALTADTQDLLAAGAAFTPSAPGSVVVPTWVHVIQNSATQGALTDSQVASQVAVLNAAFAGRGGPGAAATPFRFALQGTTRTVNPAWYAFEPSTKAERDAKAALRRGGRDTLNVYITGLGADLLGYAYFPSNGKGKDTVDGVVILNDSIPGGSAVPYDKGDTLPHEVGHWLGLQHTFANGCSTTGDRVGDTPAEASPAFDCPVGRNTCGKDPGLDPVENFMDYSDDACMYAFTRGQALRMDAVWQQYRA